MPPYNAENGENGGRSQLAWAGGFLLLALVMYFMPSPPQQQVAAGVRLTFLQPFLFTQQTIVKTRVRAREIEALQAERDSLLSWVRNHAPMVQENDRLRSLLDLTSKVGRSYLAASVVRPGVAGSESMFVLDRGQVDGVVPTSLVMTEGGLIGVVRESRAETSVGMDWTHPDFRASVMTLDGAVFGIVGPERGAFREGDRLVLQGTPFHADVAEGTLLVTSGRGGVFPRGIPVGQVETLAESEAGWRKSYWVRPLVRPGGVTHVLVDVGDEAPAGPDHLRGVWFPESVDPSQMIERSEAGGPPDEGADPEASSSPDLSPGGDSGRS